MIYISKCCQSRMVEVWHGRELVNKCPACERIGAKVGLILFPEEVKALYEKRISLDQLEQI